MTQLLVSVRDAEEAKEALAGGADVIDIKEPSRGALGRADLDIWHHIQRVVGDAVPISVALGELARDEHAGIARHTSFARFAKVGLAGCRHLEDWMNRWRTVLHELPPGPTAVAVAYADWQTAGAVPPDEVLRCAVELGCGALLLDTHDKTLGTLFEHVPPADVAELIQRARAENLLTAIGGSLAVDTAAKVVQFAPDFIAVRGAACRGSRFGAIDRSLVRALADSIRAN